LLFIFLEPPPQNSDLPQKWDWLVRVVRERLMCMDGAVRSKLQSKVMRFFGMWSFAVLIGTSMRPGLVPAVISIVRLHFSSITAGGDGSSSNVHALDVAFLAYIACCAGA
jgi:hypothetical protein